VKREKEIISPLWEPVNRFPWWREEWGMFPLWQWLLLGAATLGVNLLAIII